MLASHRDGKYIEAIEKITGQKLARREMMDIEVREENRPHRGDRHGGKGGRDRGRGRDGKQRDRRPPDGKFHDHVAAMEPAQIAEQAAPAEIQAVTPAAEPRPHKPQPDKRRHQENRHEKRPENRSENRNENREKRGSQRHHNEQAAQPSQVDKSELPAFLFRPVPVRKPEPQQ
jgi:hypothetical protein